MRVGISKADLQQGSLSFSEGNGEIVAAEIVNHQFPPSKKTGEQEELRPKIKLTLQRMTLDWKPTQDDPIEEYWPLAGKGGLDKFHPGNATGPDDEDPSDLGDEEGVSGNAIYSEGAHISTNGKAGMLVASLEDNGFKPEFLTGYMPHLVGLQAHFVTRKEKGSGEIRDWDVLVVDRIQKFPYQKGGAKPVAATAAAGKPAAAAGKLASKTAAPAATAAAPTPAKAATNGHGAGSVSDEDIEIFAMTVIDALGTKKAGNTLTKSKSAGVPASRIPTQLSLLMNPAGVPPTAVKAVTELIMNSEWFDAQAEARGWAVEGETVVIPAA